MGLPIDIGKIKNTAEKIQNDVNVDINLNFYIDETAHPDFISSVKSVFYECEGTNLDFISLKENKLHLKNEPNLAIILAGEDPFSCLAYKALDINDIPTLIISLKPHVLLDNANELGIKIEQKNVICPKFNTYTYYENEGDHVVDFDDYNASMDLNIKYQIVEWLYDFSENFKIAYASMFPIMRNKVADNIINTCSFQNAAIGAISFIPGADMPLMTLNQARMILELAAIYNYPIDEDRIIEMVVLVISAFAMKMLSNYLTDNCKISKVVINGVFGFGGTQLLGNIAKSYFASGGAVDGLADKIKEKTGNLTGALLQK